MSEEQAQAFQTKLWSMHVDSQRAAATATPSSSIKPSGTSTPVDGNIAAATVSRIALLDSSADPDPDAAGIPFKERIRPGMVVSWRPPAEYAAFAVGDKAYAMVMCPVQAVGERVRDAKGVLVNPAHGEAEAKGEKYLCAAVFPALLPGSFSIALWRQVVVRIEEMEAEVLMEWDEATRYYYMTV